MSSSTPPGPLLDSASVRAVNPEMSARAMAARKGREAGLVVLSTCHVEATHDGGDGGGGVSVIEELKDGVGGGSELCAGALCTNLRWCSGCRRISSRKALGAKGASNGHRRSAAAALISIGTDGGAPGVRSSRSPGDMKPTGWGEGERQGDASGVGDALMPIQS